jgi:mRNA interferase RelE/StbE
VNWDYRIEESAVGDLRNPGPSAALEIRAFLDKRIKGSKNPEQFGKPLRGDKKGFWRYRAREYRLLCRLEKSVLIVVVIAVGHRSSIYAI